MDPTLLADSWRQLMAPRTGDIRTELLQEAAEFLDISFMEASTRLASAAGRFREEWGAVADTTDAAMLSKFYNLSDAGLFDLIEWHATDPIHYRTLVVRDLALARPGRVYLDYGSGIGSDALVFAEAGFKVTLADISDLLMGFAAYRIRKRGFTVNTIDLKRDSVPADSFDVVVCFDVLEHIPRPMAVVRNLRQGMRDGGLLVIHAPFGEDPDRPMHVVHRDVVTPRMRSSGFQPGDCYFPPGVLAPQVYQKATVRLMDRAAYYVYDQYLGNPVGDRLASWYRRLFRRPKARAEDEVWLRN
jgi:SAM-dependent methyltransferase